jgi:hypothetical protein
MTVVSVFRTFSRRRTSSRNHMHDNRTLYYSFLPFSYEKEGCCVDLCRMVAKPLLSLSEQLSRTLVPKKAPLLSGFTRFLSCVCKWKQAVRRTGIWDSE